MYLFCMGWRLFIYISLVQLEACPLYSDDVQTNILTQLALPPLADDVRCHIIFSLQAKLLYMKCPQTKMHKSAFL